MGGQHFGGSTFWRVKTFWGKNFFEGATKQNFLGGQEKCGSKNLEVKNLLGVNIFRRLNMEVNPI